MSRYRLYTITITACVGGYIWLFFNLNSLRNAVNLDEGLSACAIKQLSGFACPSCGTTRSILHIINLNFGAAFLTNPFGFIVLSIMIIGPLLIASDLAFKNSLAFNIYAGIERIFRVKLVAITMISLVLINWIWNIHKGI